MELFGLTSARGFVLLVGFCKIINCEDVKQDEKGCVMSDLKGQRIVLQWILMHGARSLHFVILSSDCIEVNQFWNLCTNFMD